MLWKKHLSIYTAGTPKPNELSREHNKIRNSLAPLISLPNNSSTHKTLDISSAPKFLIRKKSKSSKSIKQQIPNTFYLHKGNNFSLVKAVLEGLGCTETVSKDAACLIWYQGQDMARRDLSRKDISTKTVNYFPNHS